MIVGLHAPAVSSLSGNTDPTYIQKYVRQVKDTVTSDEEEVVFQTFDCVNITFRRTRENSEPFYYNDINHMFKNVAQLRYSTNNDPIRQRELMKSSVHPAMITTILGMDWYNSNYVYKPRAEPILSEEEAKEENDAFNENAKSYKDKAKENINKATDSLKKFFESKKDKEKKRDPDIDEYIYEMRVVRRKQ